MVFNSELVVPFSQICGFDNNMFICAGRERERESVCSKCVFQHMVEEFVMQKLN